MATKKAKARKAASKAGKRKKRTAAKPAKAARRKGAGTKVKRAAKSEPVEAEVGHVMNMLRAWSPARYSTR
jgi:hypothetical protein